MARSIRIEYRGALYHVMARGNRRERIFRDDDDRRFFLKTLAESCEKTGWSVHAWVLMGNHYHLAIQTPEANLVAGMKWLQNTYTRRFNLRHRLWGRLFGDRYKAVPVEGEGFYYETLLDYIHLNPVRARIVRPAAGQSLMDYPWSSVTGGYALPAGRRPRWLAAAAPLEAFGCADTAAGRRNWVERLDRQAGESRYFLPLRLDYLYFLGYGLPSSAPPFPQNPVLQSPPKIAWWHLRHAIPLHQPIRRHGLDAHPPAPGP